MGGVVLGGRACWRERDTVGNNVKKAYFNQRLEWAARVGAGRNIQQM